MRFDMSLYATVQERRTQFLKDHPNGVILTDAITEVSDFTHAVVQARIWRDRATANPALPDASGVASEWFVAPGTDEARRMQANTTSWWENAATSAIGRALVNLGYDMNKEAPSREEMAKVARLEGSHPNGPASNATSATGPDEPATQRQLRYLLAVARKAGLDGKALDERSMAEYGIVGAALSRKQASDLIDALQSGGDGQPAASPNGGELREQVRAGREPRDAPSDKQFAYLDSLLRATDALDAIEGIAQARYQAGVRSLGKRDLSDLIDALILVKDGQQTIEALYPASNTASAADAPSPWDTEPPF